MRRVVLLTAAGLAFGCDAPISDPAYVPYAGSAHGSAVLASAAAGPIGYYPLDGHAEDASGNGLSGTLAGPVPIEDRFGIPGMAVAFDGIDDYIRIPGATVNTASEGTINLWLRVNNPTTAALCGREDLYSGGDFHCQYNIFATAYYPPTGSGHFRAQFGAASPGGPLDRFYFMVQGELGDFVLAEDYDLAQWHMYTFSWSADAKSLYFDGGLLNAFPGGQVSAPSGDLLLGNNAFGSGVRERLNGAMDDVRIYRRMLTATEVLALFHERPSPTSHDDCKNDAWRTYGFSNQGQCIRYVNTGHDGR